LLEIIDVNAVAILGLIIWGGGRVSQDFFYINVKKKIISDVRKPGGQLTPWPGLEPPLC
jgi:hypothetical protein